MVVEISTIEQLQAIKDDPAGSYILTADIDASETAGWNGGLGFEPIQGFSGSFVGMDYAITGLWIDRPSENNVGLFGQLGVGASIQRLSIDGHVHGNEVVGMLFGSVVSNSDVFIYRVRAAGEVSSLARRCGGIGGLLIGSSGTQAGTIKQCFNEAAVIGGGPHAGGIIGWGRFFAAEDCGNIGTVSANWAFLPACGGVVGQTDRPTQIVRCYSAAVLSNPGGAGGIVGYMESTADPSDVVDCYWDSTVGPSVSFGGGPKTTAEMQNIGTYVGWDIVAARDRTRTWGIDGGYPFLQVFNGDPIPGMIGGEIAYWKCDEGSGSLLRDSVGGFHGTTVGGVGWAANPGITKFRNPYYVSFGSNRPRVIVPTPVLTPTQTSTAWSCTAWVYPMAVGSGPNWSIMGAAGPSANDRGTWVLRLNIDRHLEFFLNHPGNTFHTVPEAFPEEVWSHVGCTYDGTTLKVYHNGEEKLSVLQQFDSVIPGQFWIGDRNSSTNASWSGGLDELRVFSRTLSQDEMSSLAAGGPNPRRYDPFRSHVFHSHRIGGVA